MQPYRYSNLTAPDEIRILFLSSGSGSEPLKCQLKHASLSDDPRYDAISYAWGNPNKPKEIICEDRSIPITESLFTALWHLRQKNEEIAVWADAVCIHQGSDTEKNHQLALMGQIYSRAERTLVWLGEDKAGRAAYAFQQTSYLYHRVLRRGERTDEELRQDVLVAYKQGGWQVFEAWYLEFIDTIAPIFEGQYFYRLWVVQEFALGRDIQLVSGTAKMPMDEFVSVLRDFADLEQGCLFQERYNYHALCNLFEMDGIRSGYQRNQICAVTITTNEPRPHRCPRMFELIRQTEGQFFTDPRDRLYAILSLTTTPGFSADYTLTVEETFMRFASWALNFFPNLALLSVARGVSNTKFRLPSWTLSPDMAGLDSVKPVESWIAPPRNSKIPPNGLPMSLLDNPYFSACGTGLGEMDEDDACWSVGAENVLRLKGYVVDSVRIKGTRWLNSATWAERHQFLVEAVKIAKCTTLAFADPRYQRFCAAMILHLSSLDSMVCMPKEFDKYIRGIIEPSRHEGYREGLLVEDKWLIASQLSRARHRSFCRTTLDHFAWVPHSAESGDQIFIIRGSCIPYVLRPQPDGQFMLVGECWIQGYMEGEALELPGFHWQDIFLV